VLGAKFAEMGRCNERCKENVALCCGCSIPVAEGLNSSAVGIAEPAHAADKSILCCDG